MLPAPDAVAAARATRTWPQRLFGRWWRRQSPARQDRFATLGPLTSVLLFLAAIISAFWYLRNEEIERELREYLELFQHPQTHDSAA